ncbi:hydrogenase [Xinfangfangia sp. D13-10-4-6]|uniref:3-hydroxyacyl-CoA dehydrogenase family protein n=1 Tax=Pseudogemmobacter hezensis TaxID=2737662 RepID=UPI00155209AC|nr:3-hydroxyacyl-CoA dehydrogenase NAD-binding domain-containing protein [Pseudogemmobacter hezensis]NPD16342.1 hydrogenase [Pseudogemmobacter hezensis]
MARIWILGGGLVGCGWAAAFAGGGHQVVVIDPAPELATRLARVWAEGQQALAQLGRLVPAPQAPVPVVSAADAGPAPDLVQEALPEQLALKVPALAALEPHLRPDTVIASSSSGLDPAQIAAALQRPERLVIGHPCTPPYLMPVVEICGAAGTEPAALDEAEALYKSLGKTVLRLNRPIAGHLVNRLQAALWREAVHLAAEGVASLGDIELAVNEGLAPRWCFVGPTGVFHLAGAEGGLQRCLDALGPEFERWWDELGTPRLDPWTRQILVQGMAAHDPRPVAQIAQDRDQRLSRLLTYLQANTVSAPDAPEHPR